MEAPFKANNPENSLALAESTQPSTIPPNRSLKEFSSKNWLQSYNSRINSPTVVGTITAMETPHISNSEWEVMKVVWQQSPTTANKVCEVLLPKSDWKPRTVQTLLTRLTQKGVLTYEKSGREFVYSPLYSESECTHAAGRSFLDRVFDGQVAPFLNNFLEREELTEAEIDELRTLLNRKKRS